MVGASSTSSAVAVRATSPQGIYAKLWHAQSEIGLALDVLNIIISSYQINPGTTGGIGSTNNGAMPNSALPPGSLKCDYVPRAPLSLQTMISNEKMALGSKKHQLRSAAAILMQGAQKLKKVMADESQFWGGALRLRKNNWCIVSAKTGHHSTNRITGGSQLYVHYGFQDVGSLFGSRSYAELVRNQSFSGPKKATSIELNFPNKTGKVIVVSLVQQGASHTFKMPTSRTKSTLHNQLLDAQNTLFDGELYHELTNEARSMNNSVSIVDNEIFMPISDELELKIAYRMPTSENIPNLSLSSSEDMVMGESHDGIENPNMTNSLNRTANILRCAMQLMQHRRYRQNIKERTDSFFKSSRPGGGRTAGSFGHIQQTLQQRPTAVLSMTLQALQYYSFSKRIRDVIGRATRNIKQNWWEPVDVYSIDVKASTPIQSNSELLIPGTSNFSSRGTTTNHGMGSVVSINLGDKAPAVRFVIRSHPAPCVILQLTDRPSAPIMHVTEFERVLEQELTTRAIGRICEILNSIKSWNDSLPTLQSPKFVIDIDKRCVGVFHMLRRDNSTALSTSTVILQLDISAERAISISINTKHGSINRYKIVYLEDQQLQLPQSEDAGTNNSHPYDTANSSMTLHQTAGRTMEGFREWLRQSIIAEL
ncbi:subunit 17 of mediator complex-domain-containing protein [Lobosporangium transversale]|uniref:Mediator of RNA polymerase II transcription subunit 17 n=1 Tax=Lobosporangium transversale TaxID=64571 RepID=A0A1Y2GFN2_9FUNG|nr:subunit 17 of mediator complex-domain-containing protein [Lobosporangium transversale]ORZ06328.1 subunit 17 of mediator complex-domain-containing protein [Lobosporangium transversale]|eukprot:XP_021877491.1 subunit 17 of mediator complex-domain-containing protein [Lobosporangium transversale]